MHPLSGHYRRQLDQLLEAEGRFLDLLEALLPSVESLRPWLTNLGMEARQRVDCLRALTVDLGPSVKGVDPAEGFDDGLDRWSGFQGLRFAIPGGIRSPKPSLRACARLHVQLVHGYRVAQGMAVRMDLLDHSDRMVVLLAKMTDALPGYRSSEPFHHFIRRAPVFG